MSLESKLLQGVDSVDVVPALTEDEMGSLRAWGGEAVLLHDIVAFQWTCASLLKKIEIGVWVFRARPPVVM